MFRFSLITLFFLNFSALGSISDNELRAFAFSNQWKNLYLYKSSLFSRSGFQSKSDEDKFFFSPMGIKDPYAELVEAIKTFQENKKVGHINLEARCAFPARYYTLKKRWPSLFKNESQCPDLDEWLSRLDTQEVYLVYAGPYPNNPASMFGHTFIRLRAKRNPLLDYIVGFQASVDPRDGMISYSIKGITGQYMGFFNLKPYYMNIGLYNNLESRGLWEYKIDFTKEEIQFLLKFIWEISNNTGFKYYFLDENCSYFLLTLLEAVRPELDISTFHSLAIHPIETVKNAKNILVKTKSLYRAPIKKKIIHLYKQLSSDEQKIFQKSLKNETKIAQVSSPKVLDLINEYWKYENYIERTKLDEESKKIMNTALIQRASLKSKSNFIPLKSDLDPIQIHSPSRISAGFKKNKKSSGETLSYKMGHHGLTDSENGLTRWSFIDFLELQFIRSNNKVQFEKFKLVEILSLEGMDPVFTNISWRVKAETIKNCFFCRGRPRTSILTSIGLSKNFESSTFWSLIGQESVFNFYHFNIYPLLNLGLKTKWDILSYALDFKSTFWNDTYLWEVINYLTINLNDDYTLEFSHRLQTENSNEFEIKLNLHF
ncbi:MAG: DUF4105 domain-containing protein [Halobacteriovoraceae bacterium]|nr:DUF4105 domain-containing protein [Halobacteriovoraceae bacterium]